MHTGNLINLAEEMVADRLPWDSLGGLEVLCSPYGVITGTGTLRSCSGNAGIALFGYYPTSRAIRGPFASYRSTEALSWRTGDQTKS